MPQIITLITTFMFNNLVYAQNFNSDNNPEMLIKYRKDFMTAVKAHNNSRYLTRP